jgi:hypothetical protein
VGSFPLPKQNDLCLRTHEAMSPPRDGPPRPCGRGGDPKNDPGQIEDAERRLVIEGNQGRLVVHRDQPVKCPICGRSSRRRSRQQRFCSERCRNKAERDRRALRRVEAQGAFSNGAGYYPSRREENPPKNLNDLNGLQGRKSQSTISFPVDLVGGSRRRSLGEPGLARWILDVEIFGRAT